MFARQHDILNSVSFRLLIQRIAKSKKLYCETVYERVINVATSAHRMRSENYYVELHFLEALNRKVF